MSLFAQAKSRCGNPSSLLGKRIATAPMGPRNDGAGHFATVPSFLFFRRADHDLVALDGVGDGDPHDLIDVGHVLVDRVEQRLVRLDDVGIKVLGDVGGEIADAGDPCSVRP